MSADPNVDLIAEILARHRVTDVGPWSGDGGTRLWLRRCSCWGWRGEQFDLRDGDARRVARAAATRHQAEQVAEALRHGAPEVAG